MKGWKKKLNNNIVLLVLYYNFKLIKSIEIYNISINLSSKFPY